MAHQRWALLSVSNKEGIVDFARGLEKLGFRIASTGGTAQLLKKNSVTVSEVASLTESPEMLDGRVKSLHPRIHGGILFDRSSPSHQVEVEKFCIPSIDLVAVNLYPFPHGTVIDAANVNEAIELIDIGGPAMLRGAAKNFQHVLPVIDPADYGSVLSALQSNSVDFSFRKRLAAKTFGWISNYDQSISSSLLGSDKPTESLRWECKQTLRYGENPQQKAALWVDSGRGSPEISALQCLQGKELSYNNLLDIEAAGQLVRELNHQPYAAVVVKHTNPCGVATGNQSLAATLKQAIASDPVSAFGGIIALSKAVDTETAKFITEQFYECIVAPAFDPSALEVLAQKKNLRAVMAPFLKNATPVATLTRTLFDGFLRQDNDVSPMQKSNWQCVTSKPVSANQEEELLLAMQICRHVKSNAIVLVKGKMTIGVGAGQMSRVDAVESAIKKAKQHGHDVRGSVVASDAFFPFRDCIDLFAAAGIAAVVQPGGSIRDQDSVDACNEHGIAMLTTGVRHFRH